MRLLVSVVYELGQVRHFFFEGWVSAATCWQYCNTECSTNNAKKGWASSLFLSFSLVRSLAL